MQGARGPGFQMMRALLVLFVLCAPAAAAAQLSPGARYTTVFSETLDGAPRPTSVAENRLVERLLEAKVVLVDEAQSRRLRARVDAHRLVEGQVPEGLSGFETDLIIAGVVALSRVDSKVLPDRVHRYDASIVVKVIDAATGRVRLAVSVPGRSMGLSVEEAATNAARTAADALADELIANLGAAAGEHSIELMVEGLRNTSATEQLLAKLLAVPGVRAAVVRFADRTATRIELGTTVAGARELAEALSAADLPIEVFGYGAGMIRAEVAEARIKAGDRKIETEEKVEGDTVRLTGVLLEKGRRRAAKERTCTRSNAERCAERVASDLAAVMAPGRSARGPRPLEMTALEVTNVYPARLAGLAKQEVGRVTLVNRGKQPIEDVRIEVRIPRFAEHPPSTRIEHIPAKGKVHVPLAIALDQEALAKHDDDRPVLLRIDIEYTAGDLTYRDERSTSLVIHDRNALSWDELDSVAAFVNPRAPVVLQTARKLRAALADTTHPLGPAAALFAGMALLGVRYAPDPVSPFEGSGFDYLQYPAQTLQGGGDCDDLAVLYASLAEAIGMRTLILATPGHALVAVPTGLPPQSMHLLSADAGDFLVEDGLLYVPVETTALSSGFLSAWKAGATELARFAASPDAIRRVDLRSAWKRYPPVDSTLPVESKPPPEIEGVREDVAKTLRAIEDCRRDALERELAEVEARLKTREVLELLDWRAVLLAQLERTGAQAALQSVIDGHPNDAVALANLGSLHLTQGRPKEALALYQRALAHASKDAAVDVHLDAALAAFVLGDEGAFTDHVVACLEANAKERVEALARAGFGPVGDARGSAEPLLPLRDLALAIGLAFEKSGRPGPKGPDDKRAEETRAPVGRFVVWIGEGRSNPDAKGR